MKKNSIARTAIEAIYPDGRRQEVTASVDAPYRKNGSWWSDVRIIGLGESPMSVAGSDSMQALTLGLKWIVLRLESARRMRNIRYVWPGGDMEYDLRRGLVDPGNDEHLGTES